MEDEYSDGLEFTDFKNEVLKQADGNNNKKVVFQRLDADYFSIMDCKTLWGYPEVRVAPDAYSDMSLSEAECQRLVDYDKQNKVYVCERFPKWIKNQLKNLSNRSLGYKFSWHDPIYTLCLLDCLSIYDSNRFGPNSVIGQSFLKYGTRPDVKIVLSDLHFQTLSDDFVYRCSTYVHHKVVLLKHYPLNQPI